MFTIFSANQRRLLPLIVAAFAASATLPAGTAFAEPKQGGSLTSFSTGYRTLNPGVQSGAATGAPGSQIFAGLVTVEKGYEIAPYLAKSWSVSDDQLTVTFDLVEDARFHDGVAITGEDVKFSLETVKANHPFGRSMFAHACRPAFTCLGVLDPARTYSALLCARAAQGRFESVATRSGPDAFVAAIAHAHHAEAYL